MGLYNFRSRPEFDIRLRPCSFAESVHRSLDSSRDDLLRGTRSLAMVELKQVDEVLEGLFAFVAVVVVLSNVAPNCFPASLKVHRLEQPCEAERQLTWVRLNTVDKITKNLICLWVAIKRHELSQVHSYP